MQRSWSQRWARMVTTGWWWILPAWILIAVTLRLAAPQWNDIAYDGDFEYLPAEMTSVLEADC